MTKIIKLTENKLNRLNINVLKFINKKKLTNKNNNKCFRNRLRHQDLTTVSIALLHLKFLSPEFPCLH